MTNKNEGVALTQGLMAYGSSPRQALNEVLLDAITVELGDTDVKHIPELLGWMGNLRLTGLHMFFSPAQFVQFGEDIAMNVVLRRFALSLTERVIVGLALMPEFRDRAIYDLGESIITSQVSKHAVNSSVAKDVAASLTLQPEELSNLVHGNPWIVVLYLSILTGMWVTATKEYAKEVANADKE